MRPPDSHLTSQELDWLLCSETASPGQDRNSDLRNQLEQHLNVCAICQAEVLKSQEAGIALKSLALNRHSAQFRGPKCPHEDTWLDIAGGLAQDDRKTLMWLYHAATCDYCGQLLREAMEDFAPEKTPEEDDALANLRCASAQWQREMAEKLMVAASASSSVTSAPLRAFYLDKWWSKLTLSGSVAAVLTLLIWLYARPPDFNELLAHAYGQQRTLELRLPGAEYGPLKAERGNGSLENLPSGLLEAEMLIARKPIDPHDVSLISARARVAILKWSYESAIAAVDEALGFNPDNPELLQVKAIALFERAERRPKATLDYGEAVELFSRILRRQPENLAALFNRAVVYGKLNLPHEAIADWELYLSYDKGSPWAIEAQRLLHSVQDLAQRHDSALREPLADPVSFTRLLSSEYGRDEADKRAEDYQEQAIAKWLVEAFDPSVSITVRRQNLNALRHLAGLLARKHRDAWLEELLLASHSPSFFPALSSLKGAVYLSRHGDPIGGHQQAVKAARLFEVAGNKAGAVRSIFEQVYALQRSQLAHDCLLKAAEIPEERVSKYAWIRIQLQIDRSACLMKVGNFETARMHIEVVKADAIASHYPTAHLRVLGIGASIDTDEGDVATGWMRDNSGLVSYWQDPYAPPLRAEQFYDDLIYLSEDLNYEYVPRSMAREAVLAAAQVGDPAFEALTRSHLGRLEMRLGEIAAARREFESARRLIESLPITDTTRTFQIDVTLDLVETRLAAGDVSAADEELLSLSPALAKSSNFTLPLRYYRTLATVLDKGGRRLEAAYAFGQAVEIAVANLRLLKDTFGQFYWIEECSDLFRDVVEYELRAGNVEYAFRIWMWYRRAVLGRFNTFPERDAGKVLWKDRNQTFISYALLRTGIAIWVLDIEGLHYRFQAVDPRQIRDGAKEFVELCANPKSDMGQLQRTGRSLYQLLVGSIDELSASTKSWMVDLDDNFGDLPYQVLVNRDGTYLMQHHEITMARGIPIDSRSLFNDHFAEVGSVLIIASKASLADGPPPIDTETEGRTVAGKFPRPILLAGDQASVENMEKLLPSASLFHFAGHAVSDARREGLVLSAAKGTAGGSVVWGEDRIKPQLFRRCQLVVLAACSTGRRLKGRREYNGRIVRSLMAAGVPAVIASQWDVNSAATTDYMTAFYSSLSRTGNLQAALSSAAESLRSHPLTQHPYYWSAFALFQQ